MVLSSKTVVNAGFRFRQRNAAPIAYMTTVELMWMDAGDVAYGLKWLWLVGMFRNHKMYQIWSVDSQENYLNYCY